MSIYALTVLRAGSQRRQPGHIQMRLRFLACTWLTSCWACTWHTESSLECLFIRAISVSFQFSEFVLFLLKLWLFIGCSIWLTNSYLFFRFQLKITFSRKSSLNCHTHISHLIWAYILSSCLLHTNYLCSLKQLKWCLSCSILYP